MLFPALLLYAFNSSCSITETRLVFTANILILVIFTTFLLSRVKLLQQSKASNTDISNVIKNAWVFHMAYSWASTTKCTSLVTDNFAYLIIVLEEKY